jgi:Tol biopolymer transport system component
MHPHARSVTFSIVLGLMSRKITRRSMVLVAVLIAMGATATVSPPSGHAAPWEDPVSDVSRALRIPTAAYMSGDGRWVVMADDYDDYLRVLDRATGELTRPNLPTLNFAVVVPDGSAMIIATNLDIAGNGAAGQNHLYRYTLPGGPAVRLTGSVDSSLSVGASDASADGRYVAITLTPSVDTFPDLRQHVAVLDTSNGTIQNIDHFVPGADRRSGDPTISADGRTVAFASWLGNCYPNSSCTYRTYVVDRTTGAYEVIDVDSTGGEENGQAFYPELSADGQHAIFYSNGTDLIAGASTTDYRLYVRDLVSDTTEFVADRTAQSWEAGISADGRYVAYLDNALTQDVTPYPAAQVFVLDRSTDSTHQLTTGLNGSLPDGYALSVDITGDGSTVLFQTNAGNLVEDGRSRDFYVRGPEIEPPAPATFQPLTPSRFLDTRSDGRTIDGQFQAIGKVAPGAVVQLQVAGRNGLPSDAAAVVLNLTVTEPEGPGFVTAWPCTSPATGPPLASNLNFVAGETIPNLVVAPIGVDGKVCLQTSVSAAHLVADVNGYFGPGAAYVSLAPRRVLDTRHDGQTIDGQFQRIGLRSAGEPLQLQVHGRAGVPASASAVVMNVTVTEPTGPGYVMVWPCTSPMLPPPLASNLNFVAGQTIANLVVVPVGPNGTVCLQSSVSAAHLVADISGYFPTGASYAPLSPRRLLDTRPGGRTVDDRFAGIGKQPSGQVLRLQVATRGNVDATATAAVLNVTVTEPTAAGYITVWPCAEAPASATPPLASSLNFVAGQTIANLVVVPLGPTGKVCLQSSISDAHLIADVDGFFPVE